MIESENENDHFDHDHFDQIILPAKRVFLLYFFAEYKKNRTFATAKTKF